MKLRLPLNNKRYLRITPILPMLGLLAFTGCANLGGTAQNLGNNRVAAYMEQSPAQDQPADSDQDPDYEWFY